MTKPPPPQPSLVARPALTLGVGPGGSPLAWQGVNFWSRTGGPLMWRSYDRDVVRSELEVLARHGLGVTRSFFYWPDVHPEPDRLDEECLQLFRDFCDLHVETGMTTIPTFIVGHMSGANWDPAWRGGRDLYTDVRTVSKQAWFIREATARLHDHPAVAGWLITNEMPIYGGGGGPMGEVTAGADHRAVTAWAELMVQAVRAGGGTQPVSLGDGAWGLEISGRDNGFRNRDIAARVDFLGPHCYPMTDDVVRQHLTAAFICELSHLGRPVVLEEFGLSTDFVSAQGAADYYRQVLHTSLLAGARGWIAWNNTDFDLPDQDPYRHHPFEQHFGVTTTTGEPKPPLREMQAFSRLCDRVDIARCGRADSATSLLVPSYLEVDYPFVVPSEHTTIRDVLLQAYCSARMADLAPALVREVDGVPPAGLVLVPSTKALTAPTWRRLEELAADGATVYWSYSCGEQMAQRGPWHPDLDGFTGVDKQLSYGRNNPIEDDVVHWTFEQDFGDLAAGERLSFAVSGTPDGRAFLPVQPAEATVLARDAHGNPALLVRAVGSGRVVFSTYPVEYLAARTPRVNPDDTVRLYTALASVAGVRSAVGTDDVRVFSDVVVHSDGRRYAWLVSQAEDKVTVRLRLADGARAVALDGSPVPETLTLDPFGVDVLELR